MQGWKETEEEMMDDRDEKINIMWNALDEIASNGYGLFDHMAVSRAKEAMEKVKELG